MRWTERFFKTEQQIDIMSINNHIEQAINDGDFESFSTGMGQLLEIARTHRQLGNRAAELYISFYKTINPRYKLFIEQDTESDTPTSNASILLKHPNRTPYIQGFQFEEYLNNRHNTPTTN